MNIPKRVIEVGREAILGYADCYANTRRNAPSSANPRLRQACRRYAIGWEVADGEIDRLVVSGKREISTK